MVGMIDECGEHVVPEAVDPGPDLAEPTEVDRVQATGSVGPYPDQPCVSEDLEVLGHSPLADRHGIGQLPNRSLAVAQQLEHRTTGGLPDRLQRRGSAATASPEIISHN